LELGPGVVFFPSAWNSTTGTPFPAASARTLDLYAAVVLAGKGIAVSK